MPRSQRNLLTTGRAMLSVEPIEKSVSGAQHGDHLWQARSLIRDVKPRGKQPKDSRKRQLAVDARGLRIQLESRQDLASLLS